MARPGKPYSKMLLPPRKGTAARRSTPDDNPAVQAIWDTVCRIPRGQVSTYGAVARSAGMPGRARLTGYALRLAPKAMSIPWHRVVGAGGRIVFPTSSVSHREQAKRLRAEGVVIKAGRVSLDFLMVLEDR
jgi:methylated-DNA-protein-cysteine methyltransferase related protein